MHYDATGVGLSLEALNDPTDYRDDLSYAQSKLANVLYAQELVVVFLLFIIFKNRFEVFLIYCFFVYAYECRQICVY